jgi:hypothetical protein
VADIDNRWEHLRLDTAEAERLRGDPARRGRCPHCGRRSGRARPALGVWVGFLAGLAAALAAICFADGLCLRLARAWREFTFPGPHDLAWVLGFGVCTTSIAFVVVQWWRGRGERDGGDED